MECTLEGRTSQQPRFPRCQLHGVGIVNRFPRDCPLAAPGGPIAALTRLTEKGWRYLGGLDNSERSQGLFYLRVLDVCSECVKRLGGNSHIRLLSEEARGGTL